jgi:hypothetical protein
MRKCTYFASRPSDGWPSLRELAPYFLGPPERRWFFETENDSGSFTAEGVDGTEHLEANKGRIDIDLQMWEIPIWACCSSIPNGVGGTSRCSAPKGI